MTDEKRPYRMKRRAELEAHTRLRITESAVALHERIGPARTTVSAVAEHAGVRRSTVYRHFPDEEALFDACSAHWRAANPPPAPEGWAAIADPDARVVAALGELYAYYRGTARMYESLFRDEAAVPAIRTRLRDGLGAYLGAATDALAAGRRLRGRRAQYVRAALGHALAFTTWRSLNDQGLSDGEAVELMARMIGAAQA